jgi:hypothetical protein
MRLSTVFTLGTLSSLAFGPVLGQMLGPPSFDQSVSRISFKSVDVSPLRPWARQRTPMASDDELDRQISSNLQFIFHNMLNRRHFIVAPRPTDVVSEIAQILELEDRLDGMLTDGHRLTVDNAAPAKDFVERVGRLARRLHDGFTKYFREGYGSDCRLDLELSNDPAVQLAAFLTVSETISQELTERTEDYFLSSAPGAVSLNHYRNSSISALSSTLERIAKVVTRRLEAAKSR